MLRFYHNRGARLVEAVVKSALGNAEDQDCPDLEELVVSEACVDGAPTFKRIQPRARGTAFPIKRRMSHIRITLEVPVAVSATLDDAEIDEMTDANLPSAASV